ncbi:extracellular solute-binding protein [Cohnella sp. WQ 127256]|uniref:extracellular solute-binding protein n=1 Tax=Cohnella sp. WQ 127256 TaxID=2938790 RepID=UPI0021180657|nr:extracellular solute-binding protein [Cohnella sp. WQ 127256]
MATMRIAGRHRLGLALCVCSLLVTLATGCFQSNGSDEQQVVEDKAFAPYEPSIMLKIAYSYSDIVLPEGDLRDDHFLTRYLKKKTGINIKYEWEAGGEEQYKSKLDLAIRSNDLPDAFIVDREQFRKLIQRDMIENLTAYYDPYASKLVKSIYDATEGKALKEASVDGKIYGMPNVAIEADSPSYVWVRQDWLDKLKLPAPRTLDDIEKIASAFIMQDPDGNDKADTIGIPVDNVLVFGDKKGVHGLNGVFSSYHAFPKNWIRDESGNIVYGSIRPEAKIALDRLAMWYKKGIIDHDFVLRKEILDVIELNQTGIIFGPWWAPNWPLSSSVSKDTKAEWRVYAAPVDSNGTFMTNSSPTTDRYLVVRKGYPHPEAALKVMNVLTQLERNQDPNMLEVEKLRTTAAQLGTQLRNYYPFDLLLDYPDVIEKRYDLLDQVMKGERDPESLDPETKSIYKDILLEHNAPRKNMDAWSISQIALLGGAVSKQPMVKKESLFYGTTPTMEQRWANLQQMEHDTYLQIITGDLPIDAFDSFVEKWKNDGGDQITKEISELTDAQ